MCGVWLMWGGFVLLKGRMTTESCLGMRGDSVGSRRRCHAPDEETGDGAVLKSKSESTQTQSWAGCERKEGLFRDSADLIMEIMKRKKDTRE